MRSVGYVGYEPQHRKEMEQLFAASLRALETNLNV